MAAPGLVKLAHIDEQGQAHFRILNNGRGELVLAPADGPAPEGHRPLDGVDCMQIAAVAAEGPGVVVENDRGDYVVLVDNGPDLDRHVPLDLDDADFLAGRQPPLARFGRRDDDVLELTPWVPGQEPDVFDPDSAEYADVPLVTVEDGRLRVLRGDLDPKLHAVVTRHIEGLDTDADTAYGVFANPFGEFTCVPVGGPVEPHEDVRKQTIIRTRGLLDGIGSLEEAAAALRGYADRLQAAAASGWRLPTPIDKDHGFPEHVG